MPPDGTAGAVPGWDDAELLETVTSNIDAGADSGLPPEIRFKTRVVKTIRNRLEEGEPDREAPFGVFLLLPTPPASLDPEQVETVPMVDNGLTPLEGAVWFVSAAVGQGRAVQIDRGLRDEEVFRLVTDGFGAGDVPAIVFESRKPKPLARFYPSGMDARNAFEDLSLGGAPIGLNEIFGVVDRVHEQCLVTPAAQIANGRLWADAARHRVSPEAELTIHSDLRAGLVGAFPACTIRPEQSQPSGRLDLEIEERLDSEGGFVRHAVLELKVLRRWRSGGKAVSARETAEWVRDGVLQAHAYRDELRHKAAALCCFDMRRDHSDRRCFQAVRRLAQRREVTVRDWPLFASPKAYREHRNGGAS